MSVAARQLALAVIAVALIAGALIWWVAQQLTPPALTTTPPASRTTSPLASPTLDALRQRSVFGDLPLTPLGDSNRADPFVE